MIRTSTWQSCCPPIRLNCPSCNNCSSLACSDISISPISSRNSVPQCAISTRPGLELQAPVKAPFSYPNSSLSSSVPGMAGQLTLTNGPWDQGERRGIFFGKIFFSLALSPQIKKSTLAADVPPPLRRNPPPALPFPQKN